MRTPLDRLVRAGAYFAVCWAIAVAAGVTADVVEWPLIRPGNATDPGWLALTVLCIVVELVAYWRVWPIGTFTLDRELHRPSVIGFGVAWALAEAQLFLAFHAALREVLDGRWVRALAAFAVISTFQGLWHALYWDRAVAPEHNDPAWNLRKVLLCHVPNLAVTLAHFALYREPAVFVAFQAVALVGSTWHMRFPDLRPLTPVRARSSVEN